VLTNDTDADGDVLTVSTLGTPAHGKVSKNKNGSVHYVPTPGYAGMDNFTYVVSDGKGGKDTGQVKVTIGPKPNTAPVAQDDSASTAYNTAVVIQVLVNDSDADGDALVVDSVGAAVHGTAKKSSNATTVQYTPTLGYSGPDSFTYVVSDGKNGIASAKVTVTVGLPPPGACSNAADKALIENGTVGDQTKSCATKCYFNSDVSSCVAKCLQSSTGISLACGGCYGDSTECTFAHCSVCISDSTSSACTSCIKTNCGAAFVACAGVVPP
jgi:hypothetical protein